MLSELRGCQNPFNSAPFSSIPIAEDASMSPPMTFGRPLSPVDLVAKLRTLSDDAPMFGLVGKSGQASTDQPRRDEEFYLPDLVFLVSLPFHNMRILDLTVSSGRRSALQSAPICV